MIEIALQTAIGKVLTDPAFLGRCLIDLDGALEECGLELDQQEREHLLMVVANYGNSASSKLIAAFREVKNLGIGMEEYLRVHREFDLSYSRQFSYQRILDATDQMKRAFGTTLWMHRITFYTGIFLIFAAVYAVFNGLDLIAGLLGLGGIADISYHFYKKPVKGVHRSIGNLVQLEVAFLGFINELGFWKTFRDDEDLDKNKVVANSLRGLTEKTMDLIDFYVDKGGEREKGSQPSTQKERDKKPLGAASERTVT